MKELKDFYTSYVEPLNTSSYKYDFQSLDFVFLNSCNPQIVNQLLISWLPRLKFGGIIGGHINGNPETIKLVSEKFGPINMFGSNCWWMYKTNSKLN
jgi:hypothetical protein